MENYLKIEKLVKSSTDYCICRKISENWTNPMLLYYFYIVKNYLYTCSFACKKKKKKTSCQPKMLAKHHASAADDTVLIGRRVVKMYETTDNIILSDRALFNLHKHTTSNLRGCADASGPGIQPAERHQV